MLNEFMAISKEMRSIGLGSDLLLHSMIQPSPGSNSLLKKEDYRFKILLYKNRVDVSQIDHDTWSKYMYIYQDSKNQFPIIKITNPYEMNENQQKKFIDSDSGGLCFSKMLDKKNKEILRKFSSVADLFCSFLIRNKKTEPFFITTERLNNLKEKDGFLEDLLTKIYCLFSKEHKSKFWLPFYITFDIPDYSELGVYPLNHSSTFEAISDALNKKDLLNLSTNKTGTNVDIFGNPCIESVAHKFPKLSVKGNKFFLYSRNQQTPCYKAYNVNAQNACMISEESKQMITKTAKFLFQNKFEGIYWFIHTNKSGKKQEKIVTVVFVPVETELQKKLSDSKSFLCRGIAKKYGESPNKEINVSQESKDVILALKGSIAYKENKNSYIFSFSIPGNGPSRMVYTSVVPMHELVESSERWSLGWENYDSFFIKNGDKKDKSKDVKNKEYYNSSKSIDIENFCRVINKRWNRRAGVVGNKIEKDNTFDFIHIEDVFNIFRGNKQYLNKTSEILAYNHIYLLIDVVNRLHNKDSLFLNGTRFDILKIPIVISELLYQMGIYKESYNESASYLLGSLFAFANKVQKDVLVANEKTKFPRLIGSEYIYTLLENPVKAVNLLMRHSIVYLSEAKICRMKEYATNGKCETHYNYFCLSKTLEKLKNFDIPNKLENIDKILIALGYFLSK